MEIVSVSAMCYSERTLAEQRNPLLVKIVVAHSN